MEAKHTPGPWMVDEGDIETPRHRDNMREVRVYGVIQDTGDGWGIAEVDTWSPDGDNLANARLIAAAPEMYRMLSMLLTRMDAEARDMESRGERPVFLFGAMREDVRNLLARANGEA